MDMPRFQPVAFIGAFSGSALVRESICTMAYNWISTMGLGYEPNGNKNRYNFRHAYRRLGSGFICLLEIPGRSQTLGLCNCLVSLNPRAVPYYHAGRVEYKHSTWNLLRVGRDNHSSLLAILVGYHCIGRSGLMDNRIRSL